MAGVRHLLSPLFVDNPPLFAQVLYMYCGGFSHCLLSSPSASFFERTKPLAPPTIFDWAAWMAYLYSPAHILFFFVLQPENYRRPTWKAPLLKNVPSLGKTLFFSTPFGITSGGQS